MPEESLRKAVLCAQELVPTLEANLEACHSVNKIKVNSLHAILSQQEEEIRKLKEGPGVFAVAGYVLSGAAVGALLAAAALSSK